MFTSIKGEIFVYISNGGWFVKIIALSELSNYSAMYTKTHYVMNIPIYGAHAQLNQVPKALQYQVS